MIRKLVDLDSGEYFEGNLQVRELEKIEAQRKGYEKKKEKESNIDNRNFSFGDINNIYEVSNVLSNIQCSFLIRLQCQIDYNSILRYDNNKYLDKKGMINMLKLQNKKSTFYDFYKICYENNIIIENKDKTYTINPKYHFKGTLEGRKVFKSFNDIIKKLYDELNPNDFGLVYKMLQYLNFEYNVLCKNPLEMDITKINYIGTQELSDLLEISRQQLNTKLKKLKFDNNYVVAIVRVGRNTKYYINPLVFSRKGIYPSSKDLEMFQINKDH